MDDATRAAILARCHMLRVPELLAIVEEAVFLRHAWRDGGVTDDEYGALAEAFWKKLDALDPEARRGS